MAFSFTKSLLNDEVASDHLAAVFRVLYQALDERDVSYAAATFQLVVAANVAEKVSAELEALGIARTHHSRVTPSAAGS